MLEMLNAADGFVLVVRSICEGFEEHEALFFTRITQPNASQPAQKRRDTVGFPGNDGFPRAFVIPRTPLVLRNHEQFVPRSRQAYGIAAAERIETILSHRRFQTREIGTPGKITFPATGNQDRGG